MAPIMKHLFWAISNLHLLLDSLLARSGSHYWPHLINEKTEAQAACEDLNHRTPLSSIRLDTFLNTGFISEPRAYNHRKAGAGPLPSVTGNKQVGSHHRLLPRSLTAGRSWAEPEADTSEEALLSLTRPSLETLGLSPTIHVVMEKSLLLPRAFLFSSAKWESWIRWAVFKTVFSNSWG